MNEVNESALDGTANEVSRGGGVVRSDARTTTGSPRNERAAPPRAASANESPRGGTREDDHRESSE